jgi:adenosylcobinamide-GDP ribazoletransferase
MAVAAALAAGITALCVAPGFGAGKAVVMMLLAAATAWPLLRLSRRMIGGQTGDVAGTGQQVAEIAALMVLAAR